MSKIAMVTFPSQKRPGEMLVEIIDHDAPAWSVAMIVREYMSRPGAFAIPA